MTARPSKITCIPQRAASKQLKYFCKLLFDLKTIPLKLFQFSRKWDQIRDQADNDWAKIWWYLKRNNQNIMTIAIIDMRTWLIREAEIWRFKYIIHYKLICISYLQWKREPDYKRQKHCVSNIVDCVLLKGTPCLRNHCPESNLCYNLANWRSIPW